MGSPGGGSLFRVVDAALVRAAAVPLDEAVIPAWPDLDDHTQVEAWHAWLAEVWACAPVAEAVTVASPVLTARLHDLRAGQQFRPAQLRRMVKALARYLVRMRGRATPFGLFAGVVPLRFGAETSVSFDGEKHMVRARADTRWLAAVLARLESCTEVRHRLRLVANDLAIVRGERVVITSSPHASPVGRNASVTVSMRRSRAVEAVLRATRAPILGGYLVEKLAVEMPHISVAGLERMVAQLLDCGVLISSLRPPSTCQDGLAHVLACAKSIGAETIDCVAPLLEELHQIHSRLTTAEPAAMGPLRQRMRAVSREVEQPMMVDLRLGGPVMLPSHVADEVTVAADALARATPHPAGDLRMHEYHSRFIERYGTGASVRVEELVDLTTGLGYPSHYEREDDYTDVDPRLSPRDARLLALAQQAALDGAREVTLDDDLLDALNGDVPGPVRPAPHAQLCAEVHAPTVEALNQGEFNLAVCGTGRSALALSGRFLDLLAAPDQQRITDQYGQLPTTVAGALPAQLSFPPRHPGLENIARAPQMLPTILSLAEHRQQERDRLPLHDLAVTADGERLYVISLTRQRVVEPVVANAAARRAWPPPARLLAEIALSGTVSISPFAWGSASVLPFLPRVRYRRSVLAPARWRIPAGALPAPGTGQEVWDQELAALRERLGLPGWVSVGERDRVLRLNLDESMDRALLRGHWDRAARVNGDVTVTEAPSPEAHGWAGGRAHEIVVPLAATTPPAPASTVRSEPTPIGREHGVLPGERVVFAQLYGHPDHVDTILTNHLPHLLSRLEEQGPGSAPLWWFVRYRHPRPHLRLRLHPCSEQYGQAVVVLGAWAAQLRRRGLAGDLALDTYRPETARYGTGAAMEAAEALFAADSAAACAQITALATGRHVHPCALTAASMVDLAAAMTRGRSAGMRWLLERRPAKGGSRLPREEVRQAVNLADPAENYAALRAVAGGAAIADAWQTRQRAAVVYASHLEKSGNGPTPDVVLISLLHLHHIRAIGIDPETERLTDRMARAVALAWNARSTTGQEMRW